MLEPLGDRSKRRKSLTIELTRSSLVESWTFSHTDEQAVVHGARRKAGQRYRSLAVPQTCHPGGLMGYRRGNARIRFASPHLNHFDFRGVIGRLVVHIHDAEYRRPIQRTRIDVRQEVGAADRRLNRAHRDDEAEIAHALYLAALRWHGYRPGNRYIVFQVLAHRLGLGPEVWRVLDNCHSVRNLGEYEGDLNIDERLVVEALLFWAPHPTTIKAKSAAPKAKSAAPMYRWIIFDLQLDEATISGRNFTRHIMPTIVRRP